MPGTNHTMKNSETGLGAPVTAGHADAWTCCDCGATNSGLTSDFCPVCGHMKCSNCS